MRLFTFYIIIFTFLFNISFGQQYFQTFNASSSFPSGWSSTDSRSSISSASNSSGTYSGSGIVASDTNNLEFKNCGPINTTIETVVSGINMAGRTNLTLGLGLRKTGSFSPAVSCEFSIDGTNWNIVSSDIGSSASTTWSYNTFTLPAAADNQSNLRFRFKYVSSNNSTCSNSSGNFRIDDFIVDYTPPLPVKLLSFTAKASNNSKGLLNWSTTEELGFSHFEVERSLDAKGFESIGKIKATGGQDVSTSYSFVDDRPFEGISYYRLKQVDIDKTIQYSKIVSLNLALEPKVLVYPNPTSDYLVFENIKLDEIKNVNIYSVQGILLNVTKLNSLRLNLSGLAAQQLMVELELTDNTFIKRRIVKQ